MPIIQTGSQRVARQQGASRVVRSLLLVLLLTPLSNFAIGSAYQPAPAGSDSSASQQSASVSKPEEQFAPHPYTLKVWHSLEGHLHNKIIHLPIGFGLAAVFLTLLSLRWHEYEPAIRWLVVIAAIGAVAAFVTGTRQAAALEGGSKDWVIQLHRALGISTMTVLCGWAIVAWLPRLKRWSLLLAILSSALLFITGFFGGILAHG